MTGAVLDLCKRREIKISMAETRALLKDINADLLMSALGGKDGKNLDILPIQKKTCRRISVNMSEPYSQPRKTVQLTNLTLTSSFSGFQVGQDGMGDPTLRPSLQAFLTVRVR